VITATTSRQIFCIGTFNRFCASGFFVTRLTFEFCIALIQIRHLRCCVFHIRTSLWNQVTNTLLGPWPCDNRAPRILRTLNVVSSEICWVPVSWSLCLNRDEKPGWELSVCREENIYFLSSPPCFCWHRIWFCRRRLSLGPHALSSPYFSGLLLPSESGVDFWIVAKMQWFPVGSERCALTNSHWASYLFSTWCHETCDSFSVLGWVVINQHWFYCIVIR
jgi:hypothetical protein